VVENGYLDRAWRSEMEVLTFAATLLVLLALAALAAAAESRDGFTGTDGIDAGRSIGR
jgi:hypothetical protein